MVYMYLFIVFAVFLTYFKYPAAIPFSDFFLGYVMMFLNADNKRLFEFYKKYHHQNPFSLCKSRTNVSSFTTLHAMLIQRKQQNIQQSKARVIKTTITL